MVVVEAVPGKQHARARGADARRADQGGGGPEREAVNADEPWRTQQPKPGPASAAALPAGKSFKLPNGLTVVHVPNPGVPRGERRAGGKAGSDANPPDRPGLAGFTAAMLQEGTKPASGACSSPTTSRSLGASLDVRASSDDIAACRCTSLRANFPAALDVLADVVLNPAFADAGDRAPARRAAWRADAAARGPPTRPPPWWPPPRCSGREHPLGRRPARAREASIRRPTPSELAGFWRAHYRPDQCGAGGRRATSLAADLKDDGQVAASAAGRPRRRRRQAAHRPKPATTAARLVLVDKPGAAQTALFR